MLFQKIVSISGKTYRELNETNLRGPRKHCAETSIKKRSEGSSFFQRKRCLDAHFVHLCHRKEILMSSIFSFGANTWLLTRKLILICFFPFQFIHTKDHEIMQSKLWLMDKVKFSLYQISFKAVHKSSPLLNFCLFNLRQSHLCSFLVPLLIFFQLQITFSIPN